MMLHTDKLFKDKKFPKWFQEHPIFKDVKTIKKVFPSIGLSNTEDETSVESAAKDHAADLVSQIHCNVKRRIGALGKYIESKPDMSAARKTTGQKALSLLEALSDRLGNSVQDFVGVNNGKVALKLPCDITMEGAARPIYRQGESVFRVYNKLNDELVKGRFAKMTRLEDSHQFKTFSSENIPNSKLKIVFSSEDVIGAYDIATMSMRGVSSCQSWDGAYGHCTIGSVIDPFVGIIYLTSGSKFNEYGSKMIRRCIVRFVIDGVNSKPYILLDQMYPSIDQSILKRFKEFLKAKTGSKFDIQYAPEMDRDVLHKTYMPLTDIRKRLKNTSKEGDGDPNDELDSISSYQDIKILDKEPNENDKHTILFNKNAAKKARKFVDEFNVAFATAVKETDIDAFPTSTHALLKKLKGGKNNFNYSYMVPQFSNLIGNALIKSVDRKHFTSSDIFFRRLYQSYFNNKSKIFEEIKTKLTKEMNGNLKLKAKEKIKSEQFIEIMNVLMLKIDDSMKIKLRDIVSSHKVYKQIPLP